MKSITFTSDEYNVLNKISSKTKSDCWFALDTDDSGNDIIIDLENGGKQLEIETAIHMLSETVSDESNYDYCDLTPHEKMTFFRLLRNLNIQIPPCVNKAMTEV